MQITVTNVKNKRQQPDSSHLGFGRYFAEYMFEMDYTEEGWTNPEIKPYGSITMDPSAMVLHYGQSVFEGLKAYLSSEGNALLFRPMENIKRLNRSCERLCMPQVDEEFAMEAIQKVVEINKYWIPTVEGGSLYLRPFVFASDPFIGVSASQTYKFMIIASPVGAYYPEGFNPVKIFVEQQYVRAVRGGIGEAKAAGNYAASIKAQMEAKKNGYSQVLWLDGVEQKYVEEVGTMNVFFRIGDEFITPELNGSILEGITRSSIIKLLQSFGYTVSERKIAFEEVVQAHAEGTLIEVFGTGTAAVISPVGEMSYNNNRLEISEGKTGEVSQKLHDVLSAIQRGVADDPFGWVVKC